MLLFVSAKFVAQVAAYRFDALFFCGELEELLHTRNAVGHERRVAIVVGEHFLSDNRCDPRANARNPRSTRRRD